MPSMLANSRTHSWLAAFWLRTYSTSRKRCSVLEVGIFRYFCCILRHSGLCDARFPPQRWSHADSLSMAFRQSAES